ncbi:MAG: hypothetical protein K2M46_09715 [Lachnospiraceae bacterium]|nr:hypothetical protein [Lachnospiraceae bacterium]
MSKTKVKVQLSKKISGAQGYQLIYAENSKFTKGKKTIQMSSASKTIGKLKRNTTYYVKVRAYTKDSANKKIYGKFSKVKRITIK